ncbi:hypothetical protein JCM19053_3612 [Vibrio sp. JCM 19053]|nr:hypothetical protein JCM19053_3612 [Vibrio sp. JCM 19053]
MSLRWHFFFLPYFASQAQTNKFSAKTFSLRYTLPMFHNIGDNYEKNATSFC